MLKEILLQTLSRVALILTFWNRPLFEILASDGEFCNSRHVLKSNEITIIKTCGIILTFDYLGNRNRHDTRYCKSLFFYPTLL